MDAPANFSWQFAPMQEILKTYPLTSEKGWALQIQAESVDGGITQDSIVAHDTRFILSQTKGRQTLRMSLHLDEISWLKLALSRTSTSRHILENDMCRRIELCVDGKSQQSSITLTDEFGKITSFFFAVKDGFLWISQLDQVLNFYFFDWGFFDAREIIASLCLVNFRFSPRLYLSPEVLFRVLRMRRQDPASLGKILIAAHQIADRKLGVRIEMLDHLIPAIQRLWAIVCR